jgi:hypothetical protein
LLLLLLLLHLAETNLLPGLPLLLLPALLLFSAPFVSG